MTRAARHMQRVAMSGCIVCVNLGLGTSPAEVHHIGDSADRDDFLVIPLCPQHHRQGGIGVAYHAGPREFARQHGSEIRLLAQTLRRIA